MTLISSFTLVVFSLPVLYYNSLFFYYVSNHLKHADLQTMSTGCVVCSVQCSIPAERCVHYIGKGPEMTFCELILEGPAWYLWRSGPGGLRSALLAAPGILAAETTFF